MPNYIYTSTASTSTNNTITSNSQTRITSNNQPYYGNDETLYRFTSPIQYMHGSYNIPHINIQPADYIGKVKYNDYTGDLLPNDWDWMGYSRPIRTGDMVNTPLGPGLVYLIEEDIYCVELDPTSNILHEFDISEIERYG